MTCAKGTSLAFAVIFALAYHSVGAQQVTPLTTSEAVPQFNVFDLTVYAPVSSASDRCTLSPTASLNSNFGTPLEILVQNNVTATVRLQPILPMQPQSAKQLVFANQSASSPALQIQNSTFPTLQYTASGYNSQPVDVYYNLLVNGTKSCSFGISFLTDLSTPATIDATATPNINLSAYAPPNSDPRRECYVNGTSAGASVQGPLLILVGYGQNVNVTVPSSSPLNIVGSFQPGQGVNPVFSGSSANSPLEYFTYYASMGPEGQGAVSSNLPYNIPITLPLALNTSKTAQGDCTLSVTFVPLGASAPGMAPATAPSARVTG